MKKRVGISLDEELLEMIDSERGELVPRSAFIEHLLREKYGMQQAQRSKSASGIKKEGVERRV